MTDFTIVYKCFYSKITDDMYMELDEAETDGLLSELLVNAIPWFEFPRINLYDYDVNKKCFNNKLSAEEINVIATYMVVGWIDQQLASIELVRMKYSGSDFKMTSQANHMSKLMALKKEYLQNGFHLQRLYKRRRKTPNGQYRSTFGSIMAYGAESRTRREIPVSGSENHECEPPEWEGEDALPVTPKPPDNSNSGGWEDMGDIFEGDNNNNNNNNNDDWEDM